jgi:hypothetical protein
MEINLNQNCRAAIVSFDYTCGRLRRKILYMGNAFTAPSTTQQQRAAAA